MSCSDRGLVSVHEAQKILNVRKKELFRLIESGRVIYYKNGKSIQIQMDSLIAVRSCTYQQENGLRLKNAWESRPKPYNSHRLARSSYHKSADHLDNSAARNCS